jgi:hypothetical protein
MAIALVQSNEGTSAVATTSPSFSVAPTTGNLITLSFAADDYNGTPNTGWTQSTGMEQQTFHGSYLWWRISNGSNPPGDYTIGSASPSAWVMCEWSGVDATPYDISAGQFQQTSTNSYTTPSITPTSGNRLLVASMGGSRSAANTDDTTTWLNSFTRIRDSGQSGFGTNDVVGVGYLLVTANGSTSYSSGCTFGGGTPQDSKSGLIIAFKESAGVAATSRPIFQRAPRFIFRR